MEPEAAGGKTVEINEVAKWLEERDRFIVVMHKRADGDALGSAAGLVQGLRELGKTAWAAYPGDVGMYEPYLTGYWAPSGYKAETIVAVDLATEDMFQRNADEYIGKVQLTIDHHPSQTFFALETCLHAEKASCGEIIYEILLAMSGSVSAETAKHLFYAVSTDTGCFSYSNTTAACMRTAAELIEAGAPSTELNKVFHRTKSRARVALESLIISRIEYYRDGKVAVITRTKALMKEAGAWERDADDIAKLPGQIEGVEVGIAISEIEDNYTKISVRTTEKADANLICKLLGGGGHAAAAGCYLDCPYMEAKPQILKAVDEIWPE